LKRHNAIKAQFDLSMHSPSVKEKLKQRRSVISEFLLAFWKSQMFSQMQNTNRIIRRAKVLYRSKCYSFAKNVIIPQSSLCKLFPLIITSLEI